MITSEGHVRIDVGSGGYAAVGTQLVPMQLSIFSHRFMSIAEQVCHVCVYVPSSGTVKLLLLSAL